MTLEVRYKILVSLLSSREYVSLKYCTMFARNTSSRLKVPEMGEGVGKEEMLSVESILMAHKIAESNGSTRCKIQ